MSKLVNDCLKLGFGLMRLPRLEDKTIDVEQSKKMVDAFLEAGGKYFDTAFIYEGSEEATRKALCERYPRDSYYLATKLNVGDSVCKSAEQAKTQIRISLERTGAGYFDFYLLHALSRENKPRYDAFGAWDYVKELKAQGLIRHYGFSFHDSPEVLDSILTEHPDVEFVQLQINYADWDEPKIQSRGCYEVATRHGIPVVVMEPVKGGLLANPPKSVREVLQRADPRASAASWAVRFAASLDNVMMVLSGMSNEAQMADNLSYMKHFEPLSHAEQQTIADARAALQQVDRIACTGCSYCVAGCPMGVEIPDIFSVMNVYKLYDKLEEAKGEYSWRVGEGKASKCVKCGQCEGVCPQHLPIIAYLEEAAKVLEQ